MEVKIMGEDYDNGYNVGYEDGLNDKDSFTDEMESFLGTIIDGALGVTDREEEWREGYSDGYEAGKKEREEQEEKEE
jgi:flagellar biosynthesis/type III secretory pathway protein FliH